MEKIDVSRLSVAECLALAEQQDVEKETGSTVETEGFEDDGRELVI